MINGLYVVLINGVPKIKHKDAIDVSTPHALADLVPAVCSETELADAITAHAGLFTGLHGVTVAIKPDDEIRNNTDVLANDEDLVIPVGANEVWLIHVLLYHISATLTPKIDYAFTVPSGGVVRDVDTWGRGMQSTIFDMTAETPISVQTTETYTLLALLYIGGGEAGNLQLQWAQKVATAENTILKANSLMLGHRIA